MIGALSHLDLQAVRLIVGNGSLTATAKQMCVSQPAISQRLAALEDRLGARLFQRRDGGMHPTPAAKRIAEAAVAIERLLAQAVEDVEEIIKGRKGHFRITTQCHTSYRWLSFVMRDLLVTHPELILDVVPEAIEDPYGAVARNEVDAALVYLPDRSGGADGVELFSDEMYAVLPVSHPLADRKFLSPENFRGEPLVTYTGERNAFVDMVLAPAGVLPGRLRQLRMTEAIVELARAGQGIAVLANWVWNDLASREGLVAVRISRGGWHRSWRAVVSEQCPQPLAEAFIDSVRQIARVFQGENWRRALEAA